MISFGETCPGFANVLDLFSLINLYNLNGSSLLKIKTGIEFSKLVFNPVKSLSLIWSIARLIKFFLLTLTTILSRNFFLSFCKVALGKLVKSAIVIVSYFLNKSLISSSSIAFSSFARIIFFYPP